jgi:hypothetical protein
MKKNILLLTILVTSLSYGQNTFPATGNVGIGTANPQIKLHVNDLNRNTELLRLDNNDLRSTSFINYSDGTYDNAGLQFKKSSTVGQFKFSNNNGDLMTINSNGNLFVNSLTVNTELLRLDNNGLRSTSFINYSDGTYDNAGLQFKKLSSLGQFKFSNNNGDLMTILSNGNVGIGTITPDTKLTVNGNIHAKEVKIDLNIPAPDYVFATDYNLKTLKEVETYINKNNHLPEIQSAKEFEKNGVLLAEMNMKLLQKIEELTLYAIEQEKKTEKLTIDLIEQSKIILKQNKRIEKLEKK